MADIVAQIVSLLDTNWNSANTDSAKPTIDEIYDTKRFRFGKTAANDASVVWCYSTSFTQEPSGVNATNVNTQETVTIDCRTMVTRAHAIEIRDEVKRILGANFVDTVTGQQEMEIEEIQDMSDKTRLIWRFVFMTRAKAWNVAR